MDAALERMSADYDLVAGVVTSVAEVWGPVSEELHVMQETLTGVEGVGRGELAISPNELRATREAVDEAVLAARDDPLWVFASVAHRPRSASGAAGRGTSRRRSALLGPPGRTSSVRPGSRWRRRWTTLNGCRDGFLRTWRRRSRCPTKRRPRWSSLALQVADLREAWARSERTGGGDAVTALYRRAQVVLARILALSDPVGGQLAQQDRLRGLLEAYRAKVDSLGLAEDPELEARFASTARSALRCSVRHRRGAAGGAGLYERTATRR